jgi:hypothetical protein
MVAGLVVMWFSVDVLEIEFASVKWFSSLILRLG